MNNNHLQVSASISQMLATLSDLKTSDTITPFEYWRTLKGISDTVSSMVDEAQPAAVSYVSTLPKETLEVMGVSVRKGYAQWDFSNITYSPYVEAKKAKEIADKRLKAIEDELKMYAKQNQKAMPSGAAAFEAEGSSDAVQPFNTATGEVIDLPLVKGYTRDSIVVKSV